MKQLNERVLEYLGRELFDLYKEKHPDIRRDSNVVEISKEEAMWGFSLALFPEVKISWDVEVPKSASPDYERIVVGPELFETWAESKDSHFYRMTFIKKTNTLYVRMVK